jgi:16S rRNA (guanine527-N7)-methyltransferase
VKHFSRHRIRADSSQILSPLEIINFKKVCSSFRINLSDEIIEKFQAYMTLLLEWNKRIHLVSKRDATTDRILRHFVDSLSIFKVIDLPKDTNLLDLGAGAGFPSVPIKIVREDINLSLMESIRKKSLFLQKLIKDIRLKHVSVINKRAEDLMDAPDYKEKFDIVTAKALGNLKETMRLSAPFLKKHGLLVAYKGERVEKEIKEIEEKNFLIGKKISVKIPDFDLKRKIVVIEKIRSSDETD